MFFAAGGKHTPGWNWVWKAYRSLSRKYRKNLKRLVIPLFDTFVAMTHPSSSLPPSSMSSIHPFSQKVRVNQPPWLRDPHHTSALFTCRRYHQSQILQKDFLHKHPIRLSVSSANNTD